MGKHEYEYARVTLYFRADNKRQMDAFRFLNMIARKNTSLITDLVLNYLESNGITNVNRLSKKQADELLQNPSSFGTKRQDTSSSDILSLLSTLICQGQTVPLPEKAQEEIQRNKNGGRFQKKEPSDHEHITEEKNTVASPSLKQSQTQTTSDTCNNKDITSSESDYFDENDQSFLASTWEKSLDMFDY